MLSVWSQGPLYTVLRPRVLATVSALLLSLALSGCGAVFGKVYEYEEDIYLSLDGSAEITVNASIPALVMLRGMDLPLDENARFDRDAIRNLYTSPLTEVTRVSRPWRRHGRRYIQVRLHVADVRKLTGSAPFSWATYELGETDGVVVYKQHLAASAMRAGTMKNFGWGGGELVAIRLHLPSRIVYHNARDLQTNEPSSIARGNILSWEQSLTDRLDGRPISIEVKMDRQSILYHTLWLFASAFTAAVCLIGLLIWWTVRKGAKDGDAA